jgi:hypothetical protein
MAEIVKSLWDSVQWNPAFMRRLNGWLTIFWIAMIPASLWTGWVNSVAYVSALSLWALVSGHWSAWQAARVECEQQREAQEAEDDPLEDRVVRKILEKTTVTPAATNGIAQHAMP